MTAVVDAAATMAGRRQPGGGRLTNTLTGSITVLLALAAVAQMADATAAACTPTPICADIDAQKMIQVRMAVPSRDTRCLEVRSWSPKATAPTISNPRAQYPVAVHLQRATEKGVYRYLYSVKANGSGGSCLTQNASGGGEAKVVNPG